MSKKREELEVVVLDDNRIVLRSYAMLLDVKGVSPDNISLASTGEEAINFIYTIVTNLPESTILVLLDHNLSPRDKSAGVNGETIAAAINQIAPHAILTGISSDEQPYIAPEKRIGFNVGRLTAILDELSPLV